MKAIMFHRIIPVRVGNTFITELSGRPVLCKYTVWLYRKKRFGWKKDWTYL